MQCLGFFLSFHEPLAVVSAGFKVQPGLVALCTGSKIVPFILGLGIAHALRTDTREATVITPTAAWECEMAADAMQVTWWSLCGSLVGFWCHASCHLELLSQ